MQHLPTGALLVLALVVAGGSLACNDPMLPRAMRADLNQAYTWHPHRYTCMDTPLRLLADPAVFSRAWIDPDGRVIGFLFFTHGCDLCEDRQGRMALYRLLEGDRYGSRSPRVVFKTPSGQPTRSITITTNG